MKILMSVSDAVWGGKHRFMADVAVGLVDAGHHVVVAAETGGRFSTELQRAKVPTLLVPSFKDDPEGAAAAITADIGRSNGVDVAIVCGRHDAAVMQRCETALRPGSHAKVFFRHSAFALGPGAAEEFARSADLVVTTSREQAYRQFGVERDGRTLLPDHVVVVTSGIGTEFLDEFGKADRDEVRGALALPDDSMVFAVVGRLSWEKGAARAIEAFAWWQEKSCAPGVLLVVGEGPEEETLKERAAALGIVDMVRFLGHHDNVASILAASDCLLFPTTVAETGPLAVKEAMAVGVPVLCQRIGGIPEFVTAGVTGMLFDDDEGLRAGMLSLSIQRERGQEMGRQAARTIHRRHRLASRTAQLHHELDLMAIRVLDPQVVLGELVWDQVRIRQDADGARLFVPWSSAVCDLPADQVPAVVGSIAARQPLKLLTGGDPCDRPLLEMFYRMEALYRPSLRALQKAV